MTKNQKDKIDDLFYYSPINTEKITQKEQKRKTKEREKRIKKQNSQKKVENQFDYDNEMVIKMTNKNNQKQEEKTKQKMSKKQRQILKKKKRIKLMLKFTALLIIIIAGIIFALVSPIFNIKEIDVSNNEQIKTETVFKSTNKKDKSSKVKTGDETVVGMWSILMFISGLFGIRGFKRKKEI